MTKKLLALMTAIALLCACCPMLALGEDAPVELTAIAVLHGSTQDLETLPIFIEMAEKANVHITWEYVRTDWDSKKTLVLASGDLPDFIFGRYALTPTDILLNQDYFMPLEELIDEYAPNVKRMYEEYPDAQSVNVFPDGHTYALGHVMPARPTHYGASFINKAWLDQLGLAMPESIEELTEVLKAFTENDMNGNGQKDEIGITFASLTDANFGPRPFLGAFGVYDSIDSWLALDDAGKVVYNPATSGYKAWVSWMADLYAQNLLDKEWLTHDFAQYKAKTRRTEDEIVGVQTGWGLNNIANDNYVQLLPLKGPDGHQMYAGNATMNKLGTSNYNVLSVATKDEERAAAILRWADYLYSDEYGVQAYYGAFGDGLVVGEDGNISQAVPPEGYTTDSWQWTIAMNDNFVGYVSKEVEEKLVFTDEYSLTGRSKMDLDEAYLPFIDESHNYPFLILEQEETEEASIIKTDLDSILSTFAAQWIVEGGIDEEWDSYVNELNRAGLERYLEIYQSAYDARK